MNQVSEESKIQVTRVLAVIGFAVLIVLVAWLAVQVVRLAPNAFSSLASLMESIQEDRMAQNELVIESNQSVANTNESFVIEWKDMHRNGSYAISYECVEGVSLEVRANGAIVPVDCDTLYLFPADTLSADVKFSSEKERFTDVDYTLVFIKDGENESAYETTRTITLVNATIPNGLAIDDTDDSEMENTDEEETSEPVDNTTSTPSTGTNNEVYWKTVTTYSKPVSDPHGYTDLQVTLLGIGYVSGSTFVKQSAFEEGEKGAFQFMVKNIGTKDSTAWRFEAEMPNGEIYESKTQPILKVNEHAILTVAFGDAGREGTEAIAAEVFGGSDQSPANNGFRTTVRIED